MLRLATIRTQSGTRSVRLDDGHAVETGHRDVGELLATADWRTGALAASGAQHDLDSLDYAPVVPNPEKVICVGLNYADHIAETGREAPTSPTLFPKFARSLVGAFDPIELPRLSSQVDWEAELAIVIGREVRSASATEAAAAIAGFTVLNDISARDFQYRTTQFMPGKMWERSTPVGPWVAVTDDPTVASFPISCTVNGTTMQSSNTEHLVFDAVELVRFISEIITLAPGDIIATGTPSGVGHVRDPQIFLRPGDEVVTTIEGIGTCRNICTI